jgi:hypothetical protein
VTHVPNLSQEDVEMMLTNSTDPSVQALAADWLLLNTERRVLSRFILTHHPQISSLTSGFEKHILPESVYARFGQEVLEELWKRIGGSEPSVPSSS